MLVDNDLQQRPARHSKYRCKYPDVYEKQIGALYKCPICGSYWFSGYKDLGGRYPATVWIKLRFYHVRIRRLFRQMRRGK